MADTPTSSTPSSNGGSGLDTNVASLLCYLCGWLTGLIFLLIDKDNKTVRLHAWHSIIFNISLVVVWIGAVIISSVVGYFAPFLAMIIGLLMLCVWLAVFVVIIMMMVKAYQGSIFRLPVITDLAEKQANR